MRVATTEILLFAESVRLMVQGYVPGVKPANPELSAETVIVVGVVPLDGERGAAHVHPPPSEAENDTDVPGAVTEKVWGGGGEPPI